MKGRNTTVVSIRLSDSVYTIIQAKAEGQSVPEYIKSLVIHSVNANRDTPQSKSKGIKKKSNTVAPSRLDVARQALKEAEGVLPDTPVLPPFYNPRVHKQGDLVRMRSGSGKYIEVTVPELDVDGNVME